MTGSALPREIDTAIVGGGVVGLSLALLLADRGVDVVVFDDGRHAGTTVNAGSLHVQMQSRFIRLYPEMVPAVEAALPLYMAAVREWRTVADRTAQPIGFDMTGGLMVAETDQQLGFLSAKCERERELGLDVEMLDRSAIDRLAPYLGPAVIGAELCRSEGKINPLLANQAIRAAALAAGAQIHHNTTVGSLARRADHWVLAVDEREVVACRVICAAGARAGSLVESLGIGLPLRSEPLHMNITTAAEPLIGHLVQHADRMITLKQLATGHVVIGGGWPAGIKGIDHPPHVLASSLMGNVALAAHIVPALSGLDIIRTWAGVNPTADGLSVLGAAPDHPGLYFALGGDAGYTLGPVIARLVADLVTGREPDFALSPYSIARFGNQSA